MAALLFRFWRSAAAWACHLLAAPSSRFISLLNTRPNRKQTKKKTNTKPNRPARNTATPFTLTSESSYPGCSASTGGSGRGSWLVGMFRLQNLFKVRIVQVYQRPLRQLVQEVRAPDRKDT